MDSLIINMHIPRSYDFELTVSMTDLVFYTGSAPATYAGHPRLKAALEELGLQVNLPALHQEYFQAIPLGEGEVRVFKRTPEALSTFAINLYRDETDQIHVVTLAIRCEGHRAAALRSHLQGFFQEAEYQISYAEGWQHSGVEDLLDPSQYPRSGLDYDAAYQQPLRVVLAPLNEG